MLEELGPPPFDEADREFAREIRATLSEEDRAAPWKVIGREPSDAPLADFTVPLDQPRNLMIGSTDVGDVSWAVPTVQAHAPSIAIGTPPAYWQVCGTGQSRALPQGNGAMSPKAMCRNLGLAGATTEIPNLLGPRVKA